MAAARLAICKHPCMRGSARGHACGMPACLACSAWAEVRRVAIMQGAVQAGRPSRLGCEEALYKQACNQGRRTNLLLYLALFGWGCKKLQESKSARQLVQESARPTC